MGRGRGYNKAKFSAATGAILQNALFANLNDDNSSNNNKNRNSNVGNGNVNGITDHGNNDNAHNLYETSTAMALVAHTDGTTTTTKTLDTAQALDIMKGASSNHPASVKDLVKALDLDIGEHVLEYATTLEPYKDRREKLRRKYCRRLVTDVAKSEQALRQSCQLVQQTSKVYLSLQADKIMDETKLQLLEELQAIKEQAQAQAQAQAQEQQQKAAAAATTEHEFLPISNDTSPTEEQLLEEKEEHDNDNEDGDDDDDDDPQDMNDGSSSSLTSFFGLLTTVTKCWRNPCPPREEEQTQQQDTMNMDTSNKGFFFDPKSLKQQIDNVNGDVREKEECDTASETETSETVVGTSSRPGTPATLPSVAEEKMNHDDGDDRNSTPTMVTEEEDADLNSRTTTEENNFVHHHPQLSPMHFLFMSLMRPPNAEEPTIVVDTAKDLKRLKATMVRACLTQPEIQRILQRSPLVEQMKVLHTDSGGGSDKYCTKNMKTCRCAKHKDCHEVAVRTLVDSFIDAFVQVKSKK